MRTGRFFANLILLLAPAGFLLGPGCDDSGARVYTAQAYHADADCLDHYVPLGRVEATDLPSNCAPVCLVVDEQLYLSTVCPPYPAEAETLEDTDPDCQAALARLAAGGFCDEIDAGAGDDADNTGGDDDANP